MKVLVKGYTAEFVRYVPFEVEEVFKNNWLVESNHEDFILTLKSKYPETTFLGYTSLDGRERTFSDPRVPRPLTSEDNWDVANRVGLFLLILGLTLLYLLMDIHLFKDL